MYSLFVGVSIVVIISCWLPSQPQFVVNKTELLLKIFVIVTVIHLVSIKYIICSKNQISTSNDELLNATFCVRSNIHCVLTDKNQESKKRRSINWSENIDRRDEKQYT